MRKNRMMVAGMMTMLLATFAFAFLMLGTMTVSAGGVSDIPATFASALGITVDVAMVIISAMILVSVGLTMAVLNVNPIGITIVMVSLIGVLTLVGWFPVWLMIIVIIVTAAMFGRMMSGWITGGGAQQLP